MGSNTKSDGGFALSRRLDKKTGKACERPAFARNAEENMDCRYSQIDLEVESSYVEDGALNVLVSPKVSPDEKPGDPEPRWTLVADPKTRELLHVDFCVATDEGFEYPEYEPTPEQLELFRSFARAV